GPTKVGRSSLLASVTNAKVEVSDYPYTTREPVPGMLKHEDIQFQLVEAPALVKGSADGEAWGHQTMGLARNADGLILMVDLSRNPREQLSLILSELEKARILTRKPRARVEIERKHVGAGLRILLFGRLIDCTMRDVETLLRGYRIRDAVVKIQGEATLDDVEDAIFESAIYRPAIIVANKADAAEATKNLKELKAFLGDRYTLLIVSCKSRYGLERLGAKLFGALDLIRVYTKEPAEKEPSPKPFILKRGSTVADLATLIHTDFYRRFSYAKVWTGRSETGKGTKSFNPRKVGKSYILEDKDIVELHLR
ncbi:MAG: GTPase, partial [Candidatus Bathyarchaeia archaeon]